jgi:hypothetical protein
MKTILVFALCTAPPQLAMDWSVSDDLLRLHLGKTKIRAVDDGEYYVGHIDVHHTSREIPWTREECLSILIGFPPFYRQPCVVSEHVKFNHPEQLEDLTRGGWVVAVGLTRTIRDGQNRPTPLYTMPRFKYHDACCRVRDVVGNIKVSPDDSTELGDAVALANVALVRMCDNMNGSGGLYILGDGQLGALVKDKKCADGLTSAECQLAVDLFNPKDPWTSNEYAQIRPILVHVLAAAVLGVYTVYQYVRSYGFQLREGRVKELVNENRLVYLTGCD